MSYPNNRIRALKPIHPGEMLREDFMPDYGLTVSQLADELGVSRNQHFVLRRDIQLQTSLSI